MSSVINPPRTVPVTVVVVSYNHEKYIEECLRSILSQTIRPRSIIVYDDCSPDDTYAVAMRFAETSDFPITVIQNNVNQGLCRTLNVALTAIDTEYYVYISADDVMMPERLQVQYELFTSAPPSTAMSYSDAIRIDDASNPLPELFSETYPAPPKASDDESTFSQLLRGNWIPAPSVMLRTTAVRGLGGYDERLFYEDHDLWLRLSREYDILGIDAPLVKFRELGTSLGSREFHFDNPKFVLAQLRLFAKHLHSQEPVTAGTLVWNYSHRLWKARAIDKESLKWMKQSVKFSPYPVKARFAVLRASLFVFFRRR